MSSTTSEAEIFRMAGLEKSSILGRWDFWSPFISPSSKDDQGSAGTLSEADRMKMIDDIDLDHLSVSEGGGALAETNASSAADAEAPTKSKKKKPKKKKKSTVKANGKHLQWGNAEQICFTRSIGYDRIPNKGSYPIGLGSEVERIRCTVDELYAAQQQHLLQRAIEKGLDLTSGSQLVPPPPAQSPSTGGASPPPPHHGVHDSPHVSQQQQGSQKGKKNHRKRSNSVSSVGSIDSASGLAATLIARPPVTAVAFGGKKVASVDILKPLETRQFDFKSTSNPLFQPLGEDERIAILTSSTVDIVQEPGSFANPLTDVNNEIKVIKSSEAGCNCKHTKLDKLSITKLRQELLANGHLICYEGSADDVEKLSKAELTKAVKDVLKVCVLCAANNCECFQLGIPCSAQLCACLRSGRNPGQAQSCANPNGIDLYEPDRVKEYRRKVLAEVSIKPKSD